MLRFDNFRISKPIYTHSMFKWILVKMEIAEIELNMASEKCSTFDYPFTSRYLQCNMSKPSLWKYTLGQPLDKLMCHLKRLYGYEHILKVQLWLWSVQKLLKHSVFTPYNAPKIHVVSEWMCLLGYCWMNRPFARSAPGAFFEKFKSNLVHFHTETVNYSFNFIAEFLKFL